MMIRRGAIVLGYSIAREIGFTPRVLFGVYFPRGMQTFPFQEARLLVPTNQYLKRTGVLDSWKAAQR